MSLTINGATNTLTAASGLTVAGNTAVTGTLSATGDVTVGSAGVTKSIKHAATDGRLAITGDSGGLAGITMTGSTYATPNTLYYDATNSIFRTTSGTVLGNFSSTGLAVTGTLSSTGNLTVGGGAGVRTATVSSTDNNASFIVSAGNGATGGYRFNNSSGTLHWNIYETFGAAGQQGSLGIYDEVGGGNVALFSSTALTLGTGVNLVMASGKYIEGGEGTAPAAPAANRFRIFAEDNGAGKTRLMVQFATGAAQQLAIEP